MLRINDRIKKEIKRYNETGIFKIKYRSRENDISIYLELRRGGMRKTITLEDCNISGKISKFSEDKAILRNAIEKQRFYDTEYKLGHLQGIDKSLIMKLNACIFFEKLIEQKKNKNTQKCWKNTYNYFHSFTNGKITFNEITRSFCVDFKNYLLTQVSQYSACTYFAVFKAVLNVAVVKEILEYSPATNISISKPTAKREFLTIDEIKLLLATDYPTIEIVNAFIFSCFSGLRLSDVREIKFNQVQAGYLNFKQHKTKDHTTIKLNETALKIIDNQRSSSSVVNDLIFHLPAGSALNKHLKRWVNKAGIDKHITFHCARHTFATMCLTNDIDLFTVAKLLGHADIKNTQIYAKLIDKKRDEAIDKLPVL